MCSQDIRHCFRSLRHKPALAIACFVVVALIASAIPALRAAEIDPAPALRTE